MLGMLFAIYMDKRNYLIFDESKPVVKVQGNAKVTVVVIAFMVLIGIALLCSEIIKDEEIQEIFGFIAVFGVALLFAGFGTYRVVADTIKKKSRTDFQVIMATLVSYEKENSENGYVYRCTYEYTLNGEKYLYRSSIARSGKPKENSQVHLERDMNTGEITCREDEKTSLVLSWVMTLAGVLFLTLMIIFIIQK